MLHFCEKDQRSGKYRKFDVSAEEEIAPRFFGDEVKIIFERFCSLTSIQSGQQPGPLGKGDVDV